jgi:hypothetical protein
MRESPSSQPDSRIAGGTGSSVAESQLRGRGPSTGPAPCDLARTSDLLCGPTQPMVACLAPTIPADTASKANTDRVASRRMTAIIVRRRRQRRAHKRRAVVAGHCVLEPLYTHTGFVLSCACSSLKHHVSKAALNCAMLVEALSSLSYLPRPIQAGPSHCRRLRKPLYPSTYKSIAKPCRISTLLHHHHHHHHQRQSPHVTS